VKAYAGIEIDLLAVQAARRNATNRRRTNGEFLQGDVTKLLPELLKKFSADATAVLLDPPAGRLLAGQLELLRQTRPAQVILVSCHPATLARDLKVLCDDECSSW